MDHNKPSKAQKEAEREFQDFLDGKVEGTVLVYPVLTEEQLGRLARHANGDESVDISDIPQGREEVQYHGTRH